MIAGSGPAVNPGTKRAGRSVRLLSAREWVRIAPTEFVLRGHCLAPLVDDASRVRVVAIPFDRIRRGDIVGITLAGRMYCHQVAVRRPGSLSTRGIRSAQLDPPVGPDDVIGRAVRVWTPDGSVLDLERRTFRLGSRLLALVGILLAGVRAMVLPENPSYRRAPSHSGRRFVAGSLRRLCAVLAVSLRRVCREDAAASRTELDRSRDTESSSR
jgi:hypothetical protein